ncbi:Translation protein SH3-like domain containing protein [Rhypophila sp. PSN 637]
MNATPLVRRPLGCLKNSLHQARQLKENRLLVARGMATATTETTGSEAPPPPRHHVFQIIDRKTKKTRTAFAIYKPAIKPSLPTLKELPSILSPPKLTKPPSNPLPALHAEQIKKMDPTGARTRLFAKSRGAARVGDILMVTHRRSGEPFSGVLIEIRRRGIDTAILLRNHLAKVGVEMWFKIYNKNVAGIEIVKRAKKRARRARLTYMRKAKHDKCDVSAAVFAWKKTRKVTTIKASAKKAAKGGKNAAGKKAK